LANPPTIGEVDPSSEQGAPPPRRSDRAEQLIKNKTYRSSILVQSWSATVKRAGHHGATIAPKVEAAVQLMSRSAWMASRLLHSFVSVFPNDADDIISKIGYSAMSNAARRRVSYFVPKPLLSNCCTFSQTDLLRTFRKYQY